MRTLSVLIDLPTSRSVSVTTVLRSTGRRSPVDWRANDLSAWATPATRRTLRWTTRRSSRNWAGKDWPSASAEHQLDA